MDLFVPVSDIVVGVIPTHDQKGLSGVFDFYASCTEYHLESYNRQGRIDNHCFFIIC